MKTVNEIIEFINANCQACFAFENDGNVKVTYRGKKSSGILIDMEYSSIEVIGNIGGDCLAQISEFTGFTID